jgi:hypothetical protein
MASEELYTTLIHFFVFTNKLRHCNCKSSRNSSVGIVTGYVQEGWSKVSGQEAFIL